jgi:uncharacterized protein involved in response to NO
VNPLIAAAAPAPTPTRTWRTEPYRLFFLEGLALAWIGVGQWLLLGTGVIGAYLSIFHSLTQVQGFLACFALGFLFTFVPRRTGREPPSGVEMAIGLLCPPALVLLAALEQWAWTQGVWLALAVLVGRFVWKRMPRGAGPLPVGFLWVPVSFGLSLVGAILTGIGAAGGERTWWMHDVGRAVVLQGMFTGFIIGVGGTVLPAFLHGAPISETPEQRERNLWLHSIGVLVLLASFALEQRVSVSAGFALRAAVPAVLLLGLAGLYRPPSVPGFHRVLMWIACWMLPLGNAVIAALPIYRHPGLHLFFIGSFGLLAFAVSEHVMLTHQGRPDLLARAPWSLRIFALLLAAALAFRWLLDLDQVRFRLWISCAASCFLAATLCWLYLVLVKPRRTGAT